MIAKLKGLPIWVLFILSLPFLAFRCEPYSYTEKTHIFIKDTNRIRVLATLETNGYQADWSPEASRYIARFQHYHDSLMRSNFADSTRILSGFWNDEIKIYAVEGYFSSDYDLAGYVQTGAKWWHFIIGKTDTSFRLTIDLSEYRQHLALYGYIYQSVGKAIIREHDDNLIAQPDSFFMKRLYPVFKDNPEHADIARLLTWGILSEQEKIILPFTETIFSPQKFVFHVSGRVEDLTTDYLKRDVNTSLVTIPYPTFSARMIEFAVSSPAHPTVSYHELLNTVQTEIPAFISFTWHPNGILDPYLRNKSLQVIPVGGP